MTMAILILSCHVHRDGYWKCVTDAGSDLMDIADIVALLFQWNCRPGLQGKDHFGRRETENTGMGSEKECDVESCHGKQKKGQYR